MRSARICEGGCKAEATAWAVRQRRCVGASTGAERGALMRAGEVDWVAESDREKDASGSVRGSGCRGSKGSVRLSVRWN